MVASDSQRFRWVADGLNPALQLGYRVIAVAVIGALLAAAALYGTGEITRNRAIYIVAFSMSAGAFLAVVVRLQSTGSLLANRQGISLRTPGQTYTYPWAHIAYFVVRQGSARASARFLALLGIADSPFIEVHLIRRTRLGLLRRSGTDMVGIPQVYKRLELRVRDLDGLAALMSQYVQMRAA